MTTREPGARLVFTQALELRPSSIAFFATRPAAIITCGFDVLVQLVMAAMTTWPCSSSNSVPSLSLTSAWLQLAGSAAAAPGSGSERCRASANIAFDLRNGTRSWGVRAREARLDRRKVELDPLGVDGFGRFVVPEPLVFGIGLHEPAQLLGSPREPEVAQGLESMGKIVAVEPYSGDMLPMVARFSSGTFATPGP